MSLHTWHHQGPHKPSSCTTFMLNSHWGRAATGKNTLTSILVVLEDVVNGAAVRGDKAVETPFATENIDKQLVIGAAGNSVQGVIRRHDTAHVSLPDTHLERREIVFAQVAHVHV